MLIMIDFQITKCIIAFIFNLIINYMTIQRTLSIIKPDAVSKNIIGEIYNLFEKKKLKIIAAKMKVLSLNEARNFYSIHKTKAFFTNLVEFMSSGPSMIQVLEGHEAITVNRDLMGHTDPKNAEKDTIRARFADSIDKNAVHGSDSLENANIEIAYFFSVSEIC